MLSHPILFLNDCWQKKTDSHRKYAACRARKTRCRGKAAASSGEDAEGDWIYYFSVFSSMQDGITKSWEHYWLLWTWAEDNSLTQSFIHSFMWGRPNNLIHTPEQAQSSLELGLKTEKTFRTDKFVCKILKMQKLKCSFHNSLCLGVYFPVLSINSRRKPQW